MLDWLLQNSWAFWLALMLVFVAIEMLSLDLWFAMLSGGALGSVVAALLDAPFWLQVLVFGLVSLALIVGLRPVALRHLKRANSNALTNVDRLIGAAALVLEPTSRLAGTAKIDGETWSARSEDQGPLAPGTHAVVLRIEGATAYLSANVKNY
ncbi:NfeD family protein [Galactobacter caseinivorans]|uniref:NfeD family protein n=1 Tax=Galactobacter caseinivorans TaxID=2676123 RepID=A0A496PKV6_9MICC|nr:NfeD family protein [Galactobacter caseinivorans]RKW71121.1 NfeD family protein [Galactobacter caseinivorans]